MSTDSKVTNCPICGESVEISADTLPGQHVRCPFCNGKFFEGESRDESAGGKLNDDISEADLRTAIIECRKDPEKDSFYRCAPMGARLYIGLIFYGQVFGGKVSRAKYMAAFKEIESELKRPDLDYLIGHEKDPDILDYFIRLWDEQKDDRKAAEVKGPTDFHVYFRPVDMPQKPMSEELAAGSNDVVDLFPEEDDTVVSEAPRRGCNPWLAMLGVVATAAIAIVAIILVRSLLHQDDDLPQEIAAISVESHPQSIEEQRESVQKRRDEFKGFAEKCRKKVREYQISVSDAIRTVGRDRNRLIKELNAITEEHNLRTGAANRNGRTRFVQAERTLAILRLAVVADLYSRYVGDGFLEMAEQFENAVRKLISEKGSNSALEAVIAGTEKLSGDFLAGSVGKIEEGFRKWTDELPLRQQSARQVLDRLAEVEDMSMGLVAGDFVASWREMEDGLANGTVLRPVELREGLVEGESSQIGADVFVESPHRNASASIANGEQETAVAVPDSTLASGERAESKVETASNGVVCKECGDSGVVKVDCPICRGSRYVWQCSSKNGWDQTVPGWCGYGSIYEPIHVNCKRTRKRIWCPNCKHGSKTSSSGKVEAECPNCDGHGTLMATYYLVYDVRRLDRNRDEIMRALERGQDCGGHMLRRKLSKDDLLDFKIEHPNGKAFRTLDEIKERLHAAGDVKWYFVVYDAERITLQDKRMALEEIAPGRDNGYDGANVAKRKLNSVEVKELKSQNPRCQLFRDVGDFKAFIRAAPLKNDGTCAKP